MYYLNPVPTENGSYGNPSTTPFDGALELSEKYLDAYIATMGFATFTKHRQTITGVTRNQAAYDAYMEQHPIVEKTPEQKREEAYNNDKVIDWCGEKITVTAAAQLWEYYAAEGSEIAVQLQGLIAEAKRKIREQYPDEQ